MTQKPTLCVLLEQLLFAFFVRSRHNKLVLKVDTRPPDSGHGVWEDTLSRTFDAVRTDKVQLSGGDLYQLGVGGVA
jgi:hypothetical protein